MKNLFNAAFAAIVSCLLSCVGCASTHFQRSEFNSPSTHVTKQCSKDRYGDTDCAEVTDTEREDLGYGMGAGAGMYGAGVGVGYGNGMYQREFPPAVQAVSYEPWFIVHEGERAMERTAGGPVGSEPVAVIMPPGEYMTKEQGRKLTNMVKCLKEDCEGKAQMKASKKGGK
jgi:hypothetical protein